MESHAGRSVPNLGTGEMKKLNYNNMKQITEPTTNVKRKLKSARCAAAFFIFHFSLFIFTSCNVNDPIYERDQGKMILTTNWNQRTEGIEQPADYTVVVNNQTLRFTQATNLLPELEEGTYPIHIYNVPEKISIDGTTATVATTANGEVDPVPGWLFTATTEAVYADFKEETITALMQQQVGQLTIELTVTEGDPNHIASITAMLTGIANSMNFKTSIYAGVNMNVAPVFNREDNKLIAIIRLLGLTTEAQKLTLTLRFTDGKEQTVESNLTDKLTAFNSEKHTPILLSADLHLPVQTGFEATISVWEAKTGGNGIAW